MNLFGFRRYTSASKLMERKMNTQVTRTDSRATDNTEVMRATHLSPDPDFDVWCEQIVKLDGARYCVENHLI